MSDRINLVYRNKEVPCFLLFLPVYRKDLPKDNPELRKNALSGWASEAIQVDMLLDGLDELSAKQLDFELYEGSTPTRESLIFDTAGQSPVSKRGDASLSPKKRSFAEQIEIEVLGKTFTVVFSTKPEFDRTGASNIPFFVITLGSLFFLLVSSVVWSIQGSRDRAIALARDKSEGLRKQKIENKKLSYIASSIHSGVVITNVEGEIEWVNEAFIRNTGYRLDEVKGEKPGHVLQGAKSSKEKIQRMGKCLAAHSGFTEELLNYRKDGSTFWVLLEVQPLLDEEGELSGYVGIQNDITERRSFEEALKEAKEDAEKARHAADEANQAKSAFLASMSHEIRTPMNGVIGMTSLLLDTPLNETQQDYVDTIRTSGDTLLAIINDILDFSKIESGKIELDNHDFSLVQLVENVMDLLAPRAALKNLDILYDIDETIPAKLTGDATRIGQILINLISNSIKFTAKGEVELDIRIANAADLEILASNGVARVPGALCLRFSVRDTGIGIAEEARSKLFQSFTQADSSTTRKYGGTGLGLAISKRLVEIMSGAVAWQSVLGSGSTFSFVIQLRCDESPVLPAAESLDLAPLAGKRALIADDNAACRRILRSYLTRKGMLCHEAENAESVLRCFAQGEAADFVLFDTSMPDMGAAEFAPRLAALAKPPPIILLLSAHHENQADFSALPVAAQLRKPLKLEQLLRTMLSTRSSSPDNSQGGVVPGSSPAANLPSEVQEVPRHNERVLLVEDNPLNQKVAEKMLARLGFSADLAVNGLEAVNAEKNVHYDIILMDMQMPELNGVDATRKIRDELKHVDAPWIIALTANAMTNDRDLCLSSGMNDFLSKPIHPDALSQSLNRAIEFGTKSRQGSRTDR
jgi:PAS domain S-box-containing protein